MELFRDFLSDPTICNEERLLSAISQKEGESVRFLASVLREYKNESNNMADAYTKKVYEGGNYVTVPAPIDVIPVFMREGISYPIYE